MPTTTELTAAELLFGLAAGDPWLEPPTPRRFGPHFWHCMNRLAGCSVGLALTNFPFTAEEFDAVKAGEYPSRPCPGCAVPLRCYEIVPTDERPCPWCNAPVKPGTGVAVEGTRGGVALAAGVWRWYHDVCLTAACGDKVTAMATYRQTRDLPDCANCGRPYQEGHTHVLGGANQGSFCDLESETVYTTMYQPVAAA